MITKLSILGIPFEVTGPSKAEHADLMGETLLDTRTIMINEEHHSSTNPLEFTFIHEVIHAILGLTGVNEEMDDELEEMICRSLETGLVPVIKQLINEGYFK